MRATMAAAVLLSILSATRVGGWTVDGYRSGMSLDAATAVAIKLEVIARWEDELERIVMAVDQDLASKNIRFVWSIEDRSVQERCVK